MFDVRVIPFCFALLLGAVPVGAQETQVAFGAVKTDPTLPVEVTSESLDVNQQDGSAEFQGDVVVVQGEMRLSAHRVLVVYNQENSGIDRLEAVGDVVLVNGPDAAQAERADYSIETGVVVMSGDVLLSQGPNTLSSDRMTVNLVTGTAQMDGRVKTILNSGGN